MAESVVVIVTVEEPDVLVIVLTVSPAVAVGAAVAVVPALVLAMGLAASVGTDRAETVALPALAMSEEKRGPREEREEGKAVSLEPDATEYIDMPPAVMAEIAAGTLMEVDVVAGGAVGAEGAP